MKTCRSIVLVLGLALLAGCATVTFKRGATPVGMATDEDACRSASADEAAYAECLRQGGWLVTGAGTGRALESTDEGTRVGDPQAPATASAPAVATTPSAVEAIDPMTRVAVASWWKLGGTATDLDRAIDACVDQLGAGHRPDPGATVVTAGLRACLQANGWRALGASAAR